MPSEKNYDPEEFDPEDLEAASDMFDSLAAGTFYKDHEAAVEWLKNKSANPKPGEIKMKTHTAGPLKAIEGETMRGSSEINIMAGSETLATVHHLGNDRNAEFEANGKLFASAPDLLVALENVVSCLERHIMDEARNKNIKPENLCPCWTTEIKAAAVAIRAAKGEG